MKKNIIILLVMSTLLLSSACMREKSKVCVNVSILSTKELTRLLSDISDPYGLFWPITDELKNRGSLAAEAAPALAKALAYPRRDTFMAWEALINIGPEAKTAIPFLLENLANERADIRAYSAIALASIGPSAKCAVPYLAPLLWDTDPQVPSSVAKALDSITGIDLVRTSDKFDPAYPNQIVLDNSGSTNGVPDDPVSKIAKEWWLETGQQMIWPTENCIEK